RLQMRRDRLRCQRPQVELQAARQDGCRDFLRVGRRQDELQVIGRLLERLQHRVEGVCRQHVHLVDHVHLEAANDRLVDRLIEKLADLVDAAVRRRVELDIVDEATAIDIAARAADAAGVRRDASEAIDTCAIQRLGEDSRHRRLADAAGAGEEIGVMQALLRQRIGERLDDVGLPDHRLEIARPIFARQHRGRHVDDSTGPPLPGRSLRDNPRRIDRALETMSTAMATDPADPSPLSYGAAGVDYDVIDPLKLAAQRAAASTGRHLDARGFSEVEASRGESAYVVDVGPFYLASIVECLGSKVLVADAVEQLTGKSAYAAIAQDTIAMAVNDIVTVGATPLVVQAYWAAGASQWFADGDRSQALVAGWKAACDHCGIAWGGGETPALAGVVESGRIDLAASCT